MGENPVSVPPSGSLAQRKRLIGMKKLDLPGDNDAKVAIKQLPTDMKIFDRYYWEEIIQESGDGGKVVVCRKKNAEDKSFNFVMKIRSKMSIAEAQCPLAYRDMLSKMLNMNQHAHVMLFHEVWEDDEYYYMVMEKASGGGMLSYLVQEHADGVLPEQRLKTIMREILKAVDHVHQQGMMHRDIKPDNLVMCEAEGEHKLKLIDFDHMDAWEPGSPRSSVLFGTAGFSAPETYRGCYSQQSDLYSVGVILYLLMAGKMPYDDSVFENLGGCNSRLTKRLQKEQIDWECDPWPKNPVARDLCQQLLAFDSDLRSPTAEVALNHAWLREDTQEGGNADEEEGEEEEEK